MLQFERYPFQNETGGNNLIRKEREERIRREKGKGGETSNTKMRW